MKKQYHGPEMVMTFFIQQDVVVLSGGDGWVNDPWTEAFGGRL